jgi:carbon-monoxide dehydrogenase large subunit
VSDVVPPVAARPKYVGTAVRRLEDKRLLLGRGRYVGDIKLPGMLHMAVLRGSVAHARIVGIDTSMARQLPGVVAAVTATDLPSLGPLPCIDLYPDAKPALHRVLAEHKVRYVGEPVAAVVATDPYVAEDALDLIDVSYEPLQPVVTIDDAIGDGTLLYEEFGTNVMNAVHHDVGDVDEAFAAAAHTYRETFSIHRYAPVPMEGRGVVADAEPSTGRITLHTSTQFPHLVRGFLAGVMGIAESQVRVIAPDVGGGFGAKCEFYPEEVLAPVLSLRLGRPIRWIEDRREHLISTTHAREQRHEIEVAVDGDDVVTAVKARSYTNNGAAMFTLATTPASIFAAMLRGPYRIPNYRADSYSVVSNKTPLAVYRGAGHPQAAFCMERMMDIIAADLDIDPAELRRRNMLTSAELPADRGVDIVLAGKVEYDSGDYPRCLDMALDLVDYDGFRAEQARARATGRYLGVGICSFVEETAIGPYETATVRADSSGRVTVLTGSSPHGQGHVTAYCQLVADELDIDLTQITVLYGDTDIVPDGVGTFASRSGPIGGAAARKAAEVLKDKAMRIAARDLEIDEADLEWVDGGAQVKGTPSQRRTLAELAQRATAWNPLTDGEASFNLEAVYHHQVPGIAFANATHVATVEVDPGTGQVTFLRYGVVHDCGTVINPMIVDGQVHGGVVQGIGGTMLEELVYNDDGQPLSTTFLDYLLPTASDAPHMVTDHFESPTPLNPYGMKGAGEGGATGAPGAVANAIADALSPLGVHLTTDGPFSPSRLLTLIDEARDAGGKD